MSGERVIVFGSPIPFDPETTMTTERERIELILAGAEISEAQKNFLRTKRTANEVREALAALGERSDRIATVQAGNMGAYLRSNAHSPAQRAEQKRVMASRFGRRVGPNLPHWEGNDFVLPIINAEQAKTILARHAKDYGSDPTVPMRATGGIDLAHIASLSATAAARGKVRGS